MYFIYGKSECGYTQKAMTHLKQKKMEFNFVNVHDFGGIPKVVTLLKNNSLIPKNVVWKTVPIILKDKKFIGGCDDLLKQ